MNDPAEAPATPPAAPLPNQISRGSLQVLSAARWFWWIAGLSLFNVLLYRIQSKATFAIGLGIAALSEGLFANDPVIALMIDALAVGFFVWIGAQASRGRLRAFYLGLAVYTLDGLIFLAAQDWPSAAFHALAIFFIARGAMSLRSMLRSPA
jgi:hypothetical protein